MIKFLILPMLLQFTLITISGRCESIVYRKGYVVLLNGDTAFGYIGAKQWLHTPASIRFSTDSSIEHSTLLGLDNVDEIGFDNGEHYEAGLITWDDLAALTPPGSCDSFSILYSFYQKVFLHLLVGGSDVSLFEFNDSNGPRFAIRKGLHKGATSFITLAGTTVAEDELGQIATTGAFKSQLEGLVYLNKGKNAFLQMEIRNAAYTELSLMSIVIQMNQNRSCRYVYKEEVHKRNSVFVSAGLSSATFTSQGYNFYLNGLRFKNSNIPYFKLGYEFNNEWKHPSLRGRVGMAFWSVSYEAKGPDNSYSLSQFTVEPFVSLVKTIVYAGKNSEIFIGCEGGLNISLYKENNLLFQEYGIQQEHNNFVGLQPSWFNFTLTAGLLLNDRRWEISPFYQFAEVFAWDIGYELNPRMFGVSLVYHIVNGR